MHIKTLQLQNFRNYENEIIIFDSKMNIIYGNNAQGKTNILEALYLCATSKSHRTSNSKELINFGNEEAHLTVDVDKNGHDEKIDLHLKKNNKKGIAVNKVPIKKISELFGIIQIIMFSPEDLGLIKNGPKERRRFIDLELCQINPIYYYNLKNYYHVLKQRNNLLKSIKKNNKLIDQIEVWDLQLVTYGKKIIEIREKFINDLNPYLKKNHYHISGEREMIDMIYEKNCSEFDFESRLEKNLNYDITIGTTTVGPHKDDLKFAMDGIDIRKFGSQGQQRTTALSLKLSEIDFVKSIIDEEPILLLDDVLSELDRYRQGFLIHYIRDIQTILTCTGIEDFLKSEFNDARMIQVKSGRIV